jgi:hypothetical protein
MTLYKKKLIVEPHVADVMEELCRTAPSVGRDIEFDESVKFDNGLLMDIQVCSGNDDSYWTQGVLYKAVIKDAPGDANCYYEVACTDVGESFLGEYHVWYKDDEYVVEVIRGKEQVEN